MKTELMLDVIGMPCPMPLLKLKKLLAQHAGEALLVTMRVSDRGALKDVPAFCHQQGLAVKLLAEEADEIRFLIETEKRG
ncbi:MAG: sulfurtransferase TusA family protein [Hydrogenovibrio sp.]|nr:sulfurtransferase TusA family protein [Hydrogenovibrio sp.]